MRHRGSRDKKAVGKMEYAIKTEDKKKSKRKDSFEVEKGEMTDVVKNPTARTDNLKYGLDAIVKGATIENADKKTKEAIEYIEKMTSDDRESLLILKNQIMMGDKDGLTFFPLNTAALLLAFASLIIAVWGIFDRAFISQIGAVIILLIVGVYIIHILRKFNKTHIETRNVYIIEMNVIEECIRRYDERHKKE